MCSQRAVDYVGQKFGRLIVQEILQPDANRHVRLKCKCDCGNTHIALAQNVRRGLTSSCGCLHRERSSSAMSSNSILQRNRVSESRKAREIRMSLVGKVFGRLTVHSPADEDGWKFSCRCECGKEVVVRVGNLTGGHTKTCGCSRFSRHTEHDVGLRKLYYRYTQAAKRRHNHRLEISLEMFRQLTSSPCHYCGSEPRLIMRSRSSHSEYKYNGLDRVDSTKGYSVDNVVPCCSWCNRMKLDLPLSDFIAHVRKIVEFSADKAGR
jgi:hypothetical protein